MSALVRSLRLFRFSQAAVLTVALVACATAQDPAVDGDGGGNAPAVGGGGSGSGGNASTGGTGGTLPFAGTNSFPTAGTGGGSGGKPSTGGTGAGGVAATGGTGAATGGTGSSSTCPMPYTGTLTTDSAIFTGGYGQAKTGTWKGYAFTFAYPMGGAAKITPGSGQGCFPGMKACVAGSVPAMDTAGAAFGWNLSQAQGTDTKVAVALTTPVKITLAGATAGMRVQLASPTNEWCYTLTDATGGTIPLASFKTKCWGTEGTAYDGSPVESIQVIVPGAAAAKTFDFCVVDIEPG